MSGGSWRFVAWLNGHPDFPRRPRSLGGEDRGGDRQRQRGAGRGARAGQERRRDDEERHRAGGGRGDRRGAAHRHPRDRPPRAPSMRPSPTTSWPRWAGWRAPSRSPTPRRCGGRAARHRSDARAAAQGQEPRDAEGFCRPQGGREAGDRAFPCSAPTPKAIRAGEIELSAPACSRPISSVTCIGYSGEDFPKSDGVFAVGWAQAAVPAAPSRPIAPTVMPWRQHVIACAGGPRSQERTRYPAARRRRRGLAPHRQSTRLRPAPR